jgi:hypothetical protein
MTVHTTIAVQARHRHRRLAVSAAAATAAILVAAAVTVTAGAHGKAASSTRPSSSEQPALSNSAAMSTIMALTPERLATGAFDSRYALPVKQTGPTLSSVLASMSPATRRYTEAIMSLTFAQLAAGAAGSP